jgi:hypothetical protein
VPRWSAMLVAACLLAGMATAFAQSPGSPSIYAIEGLAVGVRVASGSSAYREYKCSPSDQFDGFTWCQKTRQQRERRSSPEATYSLLHSHDGIIVYINRYQAPTFFARNEAEHDIQSYSQKFGESPRTTIRMPSRSGLDGILASWGKIVLEPLDAENRKAFAEGRRLGKGYYIDFIGNFDRSAKEDFPLYRISGGAGFILAASFDQRGRGTLRLVAVDASVFYPELLATPLPSQPRDVNQTAAERPSADADIARRQTEKAVEEVKADSEIARQETDTAKRETQLARTEIESLNAERSKLNAVVKRLESDKVAAESKAQVMMSVAYSAFAFALIAMVSSLFFVIRKKTTGPKWIGAGAIPIEAAGHSSVADSQPKSNPGVSQTSDAGDIRSSSPTEGIQKETKHQTESAEFVGMQTVQELTGHRHIGTTALLEDCICCLQPDEIAARLMSLNAVDLRPENKNQVPSSAGLYAIHNKRTGICLWVGTTDNLRDRIFNQHYKMGADESTGSDLIRVVQKNIFKSAEPATRPQAREWIRENCVVRWLVLASERQLRKRLNPIWKKR